MNQPKPITQRPVHQRQLDDATDHVRRAGSVPLAIERTNRSHSEAERLLSEPRHVDRALADARRRNFESLTADEKIAALRRLARSGLSDHGIAAASGLSVEMVRQLVGMPTTATRR
jgi:hypothetical protein